MYGFLLVLAGSFSPWVNAAVLGVTNRGRHTHRAVHGPSSVDLHPRRAHKSGRPWLTAAAAQANR